MAGLAPRDGVGSQFTAIATADTDDSSSSEYNSSNAINVNWNTNSNNGLKLNNNNRTNSYYVRPFLAFPSETITTKCAAPHD